jgi:small-conductance mechanosensitive channel
MSAGPIGVSVRLVVPVVGALFLLGALMITIWRLTHPQPQSSTRRALRATLAQIAAAAIFVALATWNVYRGNHLYWWWLSAAALSVCAVVATLREN